MNAKTEIAIQLLKGIADISGLVYMSTPITSGRQMLFADENGKAIQKAKNITMAKFMADDIAEVTKMPVINPAAFHVCGWSYDYYMELWKDIIEHVATCVHFVDGWQYSKGCATEYLFAYKAGLPTKWADDGNNISVTHAIFLIGEAVCDIKTSSDLRVDTKAIESHCEALEVIVNELVKLKG